MKRHHVLPMNELLHAPTCCLSTCSHMPAHALTCSLPARSAVIQKEDEEGKVGVKIGKELMKVAGMALKANITRLGPKVLPLSEKLIFAGNYVARKVRFRISLTYIKAMHSLALTLRSTARSSPCKRP